MGGGGRPGVTFKTKVVTKTETEIVFSLERDEAEYFTVGVDYVVTATPSASCGERGGGEGEGHSA